MVQPKDADERVTQYFYDAAGRQVKTIYPDGTFTATRYYPEKEENQGEETSPLLDKEGMGEVFYNDAALGIKGWNGRAEVQIARDGKISVTKYNLAGQTKETYTLTVKLGTVPSEAGGLSPNFTSEQIVLRGSATDYNEGGQAWKIYRLTGVDGVVEKTMLSTSTYDDNGRLEVSKDELTGAQTLYGYDGTGRQICTGVQKATDALGVYVYTANAYESTYGRLVRVHYGLKSQPVTDSPYYDSTLNQAQRLALISGTTDETYIYYEYDDIGRKIKDIQPNNSGGETCTRYFFDDKGRQQYLVYNWQAFDPDTNPDPSHGAGNDIDIVYETVYNEYGQRTEWIDAKGHSTWFEYDDFGRLYRKILDKDGDGNNEPTGDDVYEEYTYDNGRGLLSKRRNFDGSTVTYEYDPLTDRCTSTTCHDSEQELERTEIYSHDSVTGRLNAVKEAEPGRPVRPTSFTYDPVTGRPSRVSKPEGALNYEYNTLGQLSKVWTSDSPLPSGEGQGEGDGGGVSYQYFYDPAGRLAQAKTPSGVAEYDYYVNGSRKSLTLPNGVRTEYTFDALIRLDSMEHRDSEEALLASFDYTVGISGKRAGVFEMIDSATANWTYTYDGLDRLATAAGGIEEGTTTTTYTYDVVGNRTSMTRGEVETTYEYSPLDQLESETSGGGTTEYFYDGNGNLSQKDTGTKVTNYIYDSRNRLKQYFDGAVAPGNLAAEYAYDYSGNRYWKAEKTGDNYAQTRFLIDVNNLTGYSQSLLEIDWDDGSINKRYEYGDDLYCQVDVSPLALQPSYFLYDGLGSTRSLTNSSGELIQTYNYQPFGDGIDHPGELATNHLFTGEYFDQDLSYYYLRARYYAPTLGRFAGSDPVEDGNNRLHKYVYCGNDGVNLIDVLGKFVTFAGAVLVSSIVGKTFYSHQLKTNYQVWRGKWGNLARADNAVRDNSDHIIKWADEAGIDRVFVAAVIAYEQSVYQLGEDIVSLIDASQYGMKPYVYEEYGLYSWTAEKSKIGHTYGLSQLHAYKARISAREWWKMTNAWVVSDKGTPFQKDLYGHPVVWASSDRFHYGIAENLTYKNSFHIQMLVGYLKLIMKEHQDPSEPRASEEMVEATYAPCIWDPNQEAAYYGTIWKICRGQREPIELVDPRSNLPQGVHTRLYYYMLRIKNLELLED